MYIQHQNPGRAVALVAFSARVKQVILTPFTILEKIRRSYRGRGCDSRGIVFYCPNGIPAFVAVGEDWSMSPLRLQRFLITKHRRLRRCQWVKPPTRRSAFFLQQDNVSLDLAAAAAPAAATVSSSNPSGEWVTVSVYDPVLAALLSIYIL